MGNWFIISDLSTKAMYFTKKVELEMSFKHKLAKREDKKKREALRGVLNGGVLQRFYKTNLSMTYLKLT